MSMRYWSLTTILYCLVVTISFSQEHSVKLITEHISYSNGQPIGGINNVFQDSLGQIWIITNNTILRYAGNEIKKYRLADMNTGVVDIQHSMLLRDGTLLCVSRAGKFHIWNTEIQEFTHQFTIPTQIQQSLDDIVNSNDRGSVSPLSSFAQDAEGRIYALLRDKSQQNYILLKSNAENIFEALSSFESNQGMDIAILNNQIVLTQNAQLHIYNLNMQLLHSITIPLEGDTPAQLFKSNQNEIWVYHNCNSENCKIFKLDMTTSKLEPIDLPSNIQIQPVITMHVDSDDIWLLGIREIYKFNYNSQSLADELFQLIESDLSLLENSPTISNYTDLLISIDGSIWLSSGYGLVRIEFRNYDYKEHLHSDSHHCPSFCSMRGITEDNDSNKYFSYYGGIVKKNNEDGEFSKVPVDNNLIKNSAYSLSYYEDFLYWNDLKINLKNGNAQLLIPKKDNGHVTNLVDPDGKIWLATCYQDQNYVELYLYDPSNQRLKKISIPDELYNSDQINSMRLSLDGQSILMATARSGAFILDRNGLSFNQLNMSAKEIYSIVESSDGSIWAGAHGKIISYNPKDQTESIIAQEIYQSDGIAILPNFFSVLEDDKGNLWWGTSAGLTYFNTKELKFHSLSHLGEIGVREFNRVSAFKDREGRMYFGTVDGYFSFRPEEMIRNSAVRSYHPFFYNFEKLASSTNTLERIPISENGITLHHNDKMLSLNYLWPHFSSSQNILYSYKLEGFNDRWTPPSTDNQVIYSNLLSGDYNFKVRALLSNNLDAPEEISIPITVTQAWYKSIWFILLCIASMGAIYYGVYKYRMSQVLAIHKLRSKISTDLHDDVGSILTGVAMQSELLEMSVSEDKKALAQQIADRSRIALSRMRDTVWAMDASKDSLEDLKDRMLDHIDDTLEIKGIEHTFSSNIKNYSYKLRPNIRQALYLIFKESITNIAKHSDSPHVDISLQMVQNHIHLTIQDQGTEKSKLNSSGQGLASMKKRAVNLNGHYNFIYLKGYRTTLALPLS